jgi:hypothetical protein
MHSARQVTFLCINKSYQQQHKMSSKSLLPAIHSLLGEAYSICKWISGSFKKDSALMAGAKACDHTNPSPTNPGETPREPTIEFMANLISYVYNITNDVEDGGWAPTGVTKLWCGSIPFDIINPLAILWCLNVDPSVGYLVFCGTQGVMEWGIDS